MAVERQAPRQKKKSQEQDRTQTVKRSSKESSKRSTESKSSQSSQSTMSQLQQQVGNQAAQRLLVQRGQSALALSIDGSRQTPQEREQGDEEKTKDLTKVGEIKVERPEVEYYDVGGSNLQEASREILQDGKWFECEYRYVNKVENEVIKRVDIIVNITLKLPQWTGPGWEMASDDDKKAWLQMLDAEQVNPDVIEEVTRLPSHFLGLDWKQAPDRLKGEWRDMLESIQQQEQGYEDIAWRRAMVLQRRLFQQPDKQATGIFDQFEKDLKVELDIYNRQKKFGQTKEVSLGANNMVQ